jgi:hypothetical protein
MIFLMFVVLCLRSRFGESVDLVSGYNHKRGLYLVKAGLYLTTPIQNGAIFVTSDINGRNLKL